MIGSVKSKLPRDINKFMLNDENKTAHIKRIQILPTRKTENIVLSGDNECYVVAASNVENNELKVTKREQTPRLFYIPYTC